MHICRHAQMSAQVNAPIRFGRFKGEACLLLWLEHTPQQKPMSKTPRQDCPLPAAGSWEVTFIVMHICCHAQMNAHVSAPIYLGRFKGDACLLLQPQHVLHQEAVGVVPGQEHVFDHCKDTLLLKTQGLTPYHRGVDQVQTQRISSKLVQHLCWILQACALMLRCCAEDQDGMYT